MQALLSTDTYSLERGRWPDENNSCYSCQICLIKIFGKGKKYIGPPIKESLVKYNGMTQEKTEIATGSYRKVYTSSEIYRAIKKNQEEAWDGKGVNFWNRKYGKKGF